MRFMTSSPQMENSVTLQTIFCRVLKTKIRTKSETRKTQKQVGFLDLVVFVGPSVEPQPHNENKSARCHCKRRRVSCPGPGRAADVILAFVRPNKTAFMSDKCLIFGFACGVHRVPVRRARPRSIDVEFDQPKPAHYRPSSALHPGGANKRRRCPQRPAGAP